MMRDRRPSEAASAEAPEPPEPPEPRVCRLLRTKSAFGADATGARWRRGESTTAAYWCLGTMECFGPDESWVHPHVCAAGRRCSQPEVDAEIA
jgi:hypothetical protein